MSDVGKQKVEFSPTERLILLLLYALGGKIKGKLWIQKMFFELAKAFDSLREELDYDAYLYGPFSEALDEFIDMMENSGLIKDLRLTEEGFSVAEQEWKGASPEEEEIIEKNGKFLHNLDEDELILYTYVMSPKMAERSDIKERILKRRLEIVLRMLKEGKISMGLAAKLAGVPITKIRERAIRAGIKPFNAQNGIECRNKNE
ncbi:TPA: hypothetical protein EYP70_02055 [Candidatus Bathyarchaeota archaeon]|nr:hypothetical protein [Candidatus Bathyarchaeota archaeon]